MYRFSILSGNDDAAFVSYNSPVLLYCCCSGSVDLKPLPQMGHQLNGVYSIRYRAQRLDII
jgi:hypothetical protein